MDMEREVTQFADIFQTAVMATCLCLLAGMGAWFAARLTHRAAKRLVVGLGGSLFVSAALVVGAVFYGGSKSIRWDTGLTDNGTLITNDFVHVAWNYSGIPSAATLYIDYRLSGTTNEWESLAETSVAALVWECTLANATNYDYWVYTVYVPPVPTHTNGVWVGQAYETKARVKAKAFLVINGVVKEHGRAIAPPSAKRKEQENEQ